MKVKSSELKCRARKSMEGHYGFGAGISAGGLCRPAG